MTTIKLTDGAANPHLEDTVASADIDGETQLGGNVEDDGDTIITLDTQAQAVRVDDDTYAGDGTEDTYAGTGTEDTFVAAAENAARRVAGARSR